MSSNHIHGQDGMFEIRGELSFDTVTSVLAESKEVLFAGPSQQLDLDLGGVSRADSAGLALLLQWLRMARHQRKQLTFHHLPEQLLAIARAGELEPLLPIAD